MILRGRGSVPSPLHGRQHTCKERSATVYAAGVMQGQLSGAGPAQRSYDVSPWGSACASTSGRPPLAGPALHGMFDHARGFDTLAPLLATRSSGAGRYTAIRAGRTRPGNDFTDLANAAVPLASAPDRPQRGEAGDGRRGQHQLAASRVPDGFGLAGGFGPGFSETRSCLSASPIRSTAEGGRVPGACIEPDGPGRAVSKA
jgi:hypothetical protein